MGKKITGVCVFDDDKKCKALNIKKCNGCNFFKTDLQLEKGRKKAEERLKSLPKEQQRHYKDSYYNKITQKY